MISKKSKYSFRVNIGKRTFSKAVTSSKFSLIHLGGHKFHHTGEAADIIKSLDPKLSNHLKSLILSGYNRPRDLQRRATEFVR